MNKRRTSCVRYACVAITKANCKNPWMVQNNEVKMVNSDALVAATLHHWNQRFVGLVGFQCPGTCYYLYSVTPKYLAEYFRDMSNKKVENLADFGPVKCLHTYFGFSIGWFRCFVNIAKTHLRAFLFLLLKRYWNLRETSKTKKKLDWTTNKIWANQTRCF